MRLDQKGKNMQENHSKLFVKTKIWIENSQGELIFGKGKTEVLELIDQEGSIAKASQKMGLNYKKTWSHVKTLQNNIQDDMVVSKMGRSEESGTKLTPIAKEYIAKYRLLKADIEAYANRRFKEIFE